MRRISTGHGWGSVAPGELATETYFTVLLRPAALNASGKAPAGGPIMTPQLQQTIAKGVEALREHNCEAARKQFQKGVQMAPGNAQLAFLMGSAEFCLQQPELARKSFERAVNLDPNFERALLSLGEMQLAARETSAAVVTLEKAVSVNAADWRAHLVLANAYLRIGGRLSDAETHAIRAVELAADKAHRRDCCWGRFISPREEPPRRGKRGKNWWTICPTILRRSRQNVSWKRLPLRRANFRRTPTCRCRKLRLTPSRPFWKVIHRGRRRT